MTCVQSTEPGRDEVYFRIHGNSSHGLFSRRLPRDDDYYEFNSDQTNNQNQHWTNQDQAPVGRPVLWAGHLDEGQGAEVVVFIAEQDNKELGVLRDIAKAALAALKAAGTFGGSPLATAALQGAEQLVDQIPDVRTHGIIGLFSFHFRNVPGGQMEFVLLPWTGFQFPGYTQGATTSRHPNSYYEAALRGDGSTEAVHLDFNGSPGDDTML